MFFDVLDCIILLCNVSKYTNEFDLEFPIIMQQVTIYDNDRFIFYIIIKKNMCMHFLIFLKYFVFDQILFSVREKVSHKSMLGINQSINS